MIKVCDICEQEFTTNRTKQKTCLKTECQDEANRRRSVKSNKRRQLYPYKTYVKKCTECGCEFTTNMSLKLICGKPECKKSITKKRSAAARNAANGNRKKPVSANDVLCKCPKCGDTHHVRMVQHGPKIMPRIYCSRCRNGLESVEPGEYIFFTDPYPVSIPKGVPVNA